MIALRAISTNFPIGAVHSPRVGAIQRMIFDHRLMHPTLASRGWGARWVGGIFGEKEKGKREKEKGIREKERGKEGKRKGKRYFGKGERDK